MLTKIKKTSSKIKNKFRNGAKEELPIRITNDNVAVHREKTIAGGRRFKYPIQYAKHKLVYNAIIIAVISLAILIVFGWWQLYKVQLANDFFYRVTKIIPLPVASVEGTWVPYDDYLMKLRSSLYYLEKKEQINLSTEDGKLQKEYVQKTAMNDAIADTYAKKRAKDLKISVTDEEVKQFITAMRQSADGEVSQQTYDAVISDYYNLTSDEYRILTKNKLIRQKVSYAIDNEASATRDKIKTKLQGGSGFADTVNNLNPELGRKIEFVETGWIPKTNDDNGLSLEAAKLTKGQILPEAFKPSNGDGYYFVRLIDINDKQIKYEYIKVPLGEYRDIVDNLIKDKVSYFIDMPKEKETKNDQ